MRILLLAAPLALAGCASTQDVIDSAPIDTVVSDKSAEQVLFCLQNKTGVAPADLDGGKVILYKGSFGGLIAAFDVRPNPNGSGSVTEIRKGSSVAVPRFKSCF